MKHLEFRLQDVEGELLHGVTLYLPKIKNLLELGTVDVETVITVVMLAIIMAAEVVTIAAIVVATTIATEATIAAKCITVMPAIRMPTAT